MADYTRNFNANYDFGRRSFAEDRDDSHPIFYLEKKLNPKTDKIEEIEMVKVQQPNERLNTWGGPVTDVHRLRWPRHYEAFKRNDVMPIDGTPLSRWPEVAANIEFLDQMKALHLITIEDMAGMTDLACQNFHNGMTWRKRAQIYLDQQKNSDAAVAVARDLEKTRQIAELQQQVADLVAQRNVKVISAGPELAEVNARLNGDMPPPLISEVEPIKRGPGRPRMGLSAGTEA